MPFINSSSSISIIEWAGVVTSLTGSVLNANGRRSSFIFWTLSAVLLGMVALFIGRLGWLALQGTSVAINLYGIQNWRGDAPTRTLEQEK